MPQEIKIDGIGISPDVLTAIVSRAVSDVEGIASVGVKDLATNLFSMMLSSKAPASEPAVEAEVVGDKLALTVRVVVFFGYPFKKLAEAVRAAVVAAIDAQVGVEVERLAVLVGGGDKALDLQARDVVDVVFNVGADIAHAVGRAGDSGVRAPDGDVGLRVVVSLCVY